MRRFRLAAIGLLLAFGTPALAQEQDDAAAIQTLTEEWTAAFNAGDATTLAAWYTDDANAQPSAATISSVGHVSSPENCSKRPRKASLAASGPV